MKNYPLLQSQMGVFLECQAAPGDIRYNNAEGVRLEYDVDLNRLAQALQKVVQNRPILRTRFRIDETGDVRQWSDPDMQIPVIRRKCSDVELQKYIKNGFVRPYDLLSGEPLVQFEIVETEVRPYLLLDFHHCISDGTSIDQLFTREDLTLAYDGKELSGPEYNLYEAAEQEQASFDTDEYRKAKEYYAEKWGDVSFSEIPHTSVDRENYMLHTETVTLERDECDSWCRTHETKTYFLMEIAVALTLSRLSRQPRAAFLSLHHGRLTSELKSAFGMFIKNMPVLIDLPDELTVTEALHILRSDLHDYHKNATYPFTHFCRDLKFSPGISLNFINHSDNFSVNLRGRKYPYDRLIGTDYRSEINLNIQGFTDQYEITVYGSLAMYDRDTLRRLAESIRNAVRNIMAVKDAKLKEISLVSEEEKQHLITLGTGKKAAYDCRKTVVDLFLNQVKDHPEATAVVDETSSITYRELDRRSSVLAAELLNRGVKQNDFVVVKLPRVKEFVLAVLGIWKAGAAYVPVDPEYPAERIRYMVEDAGAKIMIDGELLAGIDFEQAAESVNFSAPDKMAYMIYTSGSTGKPKGVMISHESLGAFLAWLPVELGLKPGDSVAEHASFSFDASICDLYPSIVSGATLHILGEELRKDLPGLAAYIVSNRIIGVTCSTQLGMELLNSCNINMRYMILGGEKLKQVAKTTTRLYNGYGPTEFTCWSSHHIVDQEHDGDDIPIGRPVPNTVSAIVDAVGNLLPRGMTGELVLIGTQIARGYWHRPELTAERFADCPFAAGKKMYRTGDLARWNEAGELIYCGRIDNQIKLRGFRIELGEIESALAKISGITDAVAEIKTINNIPHLAAYYVSETKIDETDLKIELAKTLTEYMVPDIYVRLEKLPLTPNGKINRKALPVPELKTEEIVPPENDFERKALDIVIRELGTDKIGVTTNLISMGLTSIRAIRLAVAVSKATGWTIRTGDILANPRIRSWQKIERAEQVVIGTLPERETYPLTANQMGIYLSWEQNPSGLQYNIPMAWKLDNVKAETLAQALEKVINAHPYFKVHLAIRNGKVVQVRRDSAAPPLLLEKTDSKPDASFFQSRVRAFDLLKDNLARFEVYDTPEAVYLFIDVHHILFDGTSANILLSELERAYSGIDLKPEKVNAYSYALFCEGREKSEWYEKAEKYFSELLSETESFLYPSSRGKDAENGNLEDCKQEIPAQTIRSRCRELGITENAFFAATICELFYRVSRNATIQISTVSAGRSLEQLDNTIGMFVQTLPLVWKAGKGRSTEEALGAMQDQIASTLKNELFPYMVLSEKYHVTPNVIYVYQGDVFSDENEHIKKQVIPLKLDTAKVPLSVSVTPGKNSYSLCIEYDSGLYSSEEMEKLLRTLADFASVLSTVPPDTRMEQVSPVLEEEAHRLLELGAGKKIDYDYEKTVVDLFLNQVKAHPEATAVVDLASSITYGELNRQSDVLAAFLLKQGIRTNDFVVVKLPRVKEFVLAVLGIWKSGAAYVPVDPEYPTERIRYMVEDAGAKIIIDRQFLAGIDFGKTAEPLNLAAPDKLAYMIYTSGSTGKPKGVMISHESLGAFLAWLPVELGLKPGDAVAEHASFSFDASICDLYPSIVSGATLHIFGEELRKDLPGLAAYIASNRIIGASFSTQLGMEFLNSCTINMRYMNLGGEKLKQVAKTTTRLYNGYGPTEFTCWSSHHIVDQEHDGDDIPIGRPVPNTVSAIVDAAGNLLPRGMTGELVLIGTQIARGYWHRPELTAERFADCPFAAGKKMYRTGDLARWDEGGELIYCGRIDNQIKIRGFRIELGEIESALAKISGISGTVAEIKTINNIPHLTAYYVSETKIDETILKTELAKTLTEYMVPDVYVRLEKLPLTPNGKIDRKALPNPTMEAIQGEYVEPETDEERAICEIFGDVLKIGHYGAITDFFKGGGTSILGIRVVAELQRRNFNVVYGDIFKYKTPRALAEFLMKPQEKQNDAVNTFDYGNYDYTGINAALQKTGTDLFANFELHPLGNVLLTGATGYLGIHVLKYLLDSSDSRIGLLIRTKNNMSPEKRLATEYIYYFDDMFPEKYRKRLTFIDGDITDTDLQTKLSVFRYDTVINCAAMVKHYVADDRMDQANVTGVRNLIDCCVKTGARMVQTSTYSVGGVIDQTSDQVLDERHLYIGQSSENDYIRTKFLAERYLLEAVAAGKLRGKIMRLGNLMGRESDGEFQINIASNAFVNSLKTFSILGAYPLMRITEHVEMSPIDRVAEAVVMLASTPDDMLIFQPYNAYHMDMGTMLDAICKIGHKIDYVSNEDFSARIEAARNDPARVKYLQGLLHYGGHMSSDRKMAVPDNNWTTTVLYRLGFRWKQPDERYLAKFLQILEQMRVFQQ